jgi:superfamily II DNA or RNA helicase
MATPPPLQQILETVRKATLPAIWSQGVKLVRENAVTRDAEGRVRASEVVARVRTPGHLVAPTVTLYLESDEWSCDCGGKVDPCAHVAAAAIFAAQAPAPPASDAAAPGAEGLAEQKQERERQARIVYRLGREGNLLTLARVIVRGDGREETVTSLAAELSRGKSADLSATHDDIRVDRILGANPRRFVPLARIADLFEAMAGSAVMLDGASVKVSGEPVPPVASVEDAAGGFLLRIDRNPEIAAVIAKGVARIGDTLRPLTETDTTGDLLERLPLSRVFRGAEKAELVTRVLPELEKKLDVTIVTADLPRKSVSTRPRIHMDLSHQGHTLSILPTLVYGDPPIARVDGDVLTPLGQAVPVRRRDEERAAIARLRDELNLAPGRRVDLDGGDALRFAQRLRDFQRTAGEDRQAAIFVGESLTARIVFDRGALDVLFEYEAAGGEPTRRADGATVLRAWRDGLDLVPLEGGGWAPLPAEWLARHGHRVADLLSARDAEKKLARSALPELGVLCEALDAPRPMEVAALAPLLDGFAGIPAATLPGDLRATLRAYQTRGVDWLSFLRDAELGAVLADDMGLGKTLQTIAVLRGRALVVCPKSVLHNWAAEIARFRPGVRVALFHGASRTLDPGADVTLTTYAVLRLDTGALAGEAWDAVVLDEAQAIKNESSQTARAAFALRGSFRVALSGTPVENRLEELWSVMHFANPGLLGGRSDFQERYGAPIAAGDPGAAERLRAKIRPFVLRRMKRDVLPELPPRTDQVLHVELDDSERAVYDAVRVATKRDVAERLGQEGGLLAALEALLRLRQASCHPALVPGQTAETSSKVEALVEALSDAAADGHKVLVFSQWTSLLDLVDPHLRAESIAFTRLDGSTRDRAAVVGEFQAEEGPPVMLVSLKAGGTGLNLTAADHVFLLDPWWNPAVEDQAADRAHRIGQERPVMVYRMVAKDTVEERILALQEKKRAIADVALGDASQAAGITREELLGLLE